MGRFSRRSQAPSLERKLADLDKKSAFSSWSPDPCPRSAAERPPTPTTLARLEWGKAKNDNSILLFDTSPKFGSRVRVEVRLRARRNLQHHHFQCDCAAIQGQQTQQAASRAASTSVIAEHGRVRETDQCAPASTLAPRCAARRLLLIFIIFGSTRASAGGRRQRRLHSQRGRAGWRRRRFRRRGLVGRGRRLAEARDPAAREAAQLRTRRGSVCACRPAPPFSRDRLPTRRLRAALRDAPALVAVHRAFRAPHLRRPAAAYQGFGFAAPGWRLS